MKDSQLHAHIVVKTSNYFTLSLCSRPPKEPAVQSPCNHERTEVCDRCELLKTSIQAIEAGLVAQNDNLTPEVKEELSFTVKQAKSAILAWKSHLLRSVNQDATRLEVLDSLDESWVLLVQDWAMKYFPRKYRESQSDWYGKRGILWHITVATRKSAVKYEMLSSHLSIVQSR